MMDIAERAKMRSRARSRVKGKQVAVQYDVIELSSSDDELSLLPASKSKSQPKAKKTQEKGKKGKGSNQSVCRDWRAVRDREVGERRRERVRMPVQVTRRDRHFPERRMARAEQRIGDGPERIMERYL